MSLRKKRTKSIFLVTDFLLNRYLPIISPSPSSAPLKYIPIFFSRDLDTFSKKHLEQSNGVNPAANKGELCFDIPSKYANIFFLSETIL